MLNPRLIALEGLGGTPRHVAVRGLWTAEVVEPPVYIPGSGAPWTPKRERERLRLTGYAEVLLSAGAAGAAGILLRGAGRANIEAAALLEQLAAARMHLGGGRLMAPMVADQEALGALRERGRKLRNTILMSADGTADAMDADALAILLLLGDL